MRASFISILAGALIGGVTTLPAFAQSSEPFEPETIQIGLSTDRVTLTAGFNGADLTIFGSVENADALQARTRGYDVIVVLEGPSDPVVVRRKSRVLGMWINTRSETFVDVPISYSTATTRPTQDIATVQNYRRLSLGANNIHLEPKDPQTNVATIKEFGDALRNRKQAAGLYSVNQGGVQFLSRSLFRATLRLAPDVPVGTHRARAFLFKNGDFIQENSAQLDIRKSGFEQSIFDYAHKHGFLYGVACVLLAMFIGWAGQFLFRRS